MYASSWHLFNLNSPNQLGDVLFNRMDLPKPLKYGKGKVISTAQDILEDLAQHHEVPMMVLEHRQLQKLKSTYLDQLPVLADAQGRVHTTFNQVGTAPGRLSSTNPNLQNIPIRPGDPGSVHCGGRQSTDVGGLLADRIAVNGAFFG